MSPPPLAMPYANEATKELFVEPTEARKRWLAGEEYSGNHWWVRDGIRGYVVGKFAPEEMNEPMRKIVYAPCYPKL